MRASFFSHRVLVAALVGLVCGWFGATPTLGESADSRGRIRANPRASGQQQAQKPAQKRERAERKRNKARARRAKANRAKARESAARLRRGQRSPADERDKKTRGDETREQGGDDSRDSETLRNDQRRASEGDAASPAPAQAESTGAGESDQASDDVAAGARDATPTESSEHSAPPTRKPADALSRERDRHTARLAEINRLHELALAEGDADLRRKVAEMRRLEAERHARIVKRFKRR